jgi:hypothetical protein
MQSLNLSLRMTAAARRGLRLAVTAAVFGLLALAATPANAAPPAQDGAATPEIPMTLAEKQGCGCHSLEKESWQMSPHGQLDAEGQPAAACATCHGEYVEGHPDAGMIPLATDSSACIDCHKQTGTEWEGTIHAEAGIQCISCHVSHTQDLRVASDQLCESCHRDTLQDPLHTAHWLGEAGCTSCHLADGSPHRGEDIASTDPQAMLAAAPRHDFVSVSSARCLDCHTKDVTALNGPLQSDFMVRNDLMQAAEQVPQLRAELETAQQANRTLSIWQPVSLGTGIGVGGILGIAFVLIAVRVGQANAKPAARTKPAGKDGTGRHHTGSDEGDAA